MSREINTFAYNESFIINQLKIHLLNILYKKIQIVAMKFTRVILQKNLPRNTK